MKSYTQAFLISTLTVIMLLFSSPGLFAQSRNSGNNDFFRFLIQVAALGLYAENLEQPVDLEGGFRFGIGIGSYNFAEEDDVRLENKPVDATDDAVVNPLMQGVMTQWYLEYYTSDSFGWGIKSISAGSSATLSETFVGGVSTTETLNISVDIELITLQAILLTSTGKEARLGFKLGAGTANYTVTSTDDVYSSNAAPTEAQTLETLNETGTAGLIEVFFDFGGKYFGATVGYQQIDTSFAEVEQEGSDPIEISGSGSGVYLDFRWVF